MNPPFGTKANSQIFERFLQTACHITDGPIFLIHQKKFKGLDSLVKSFQRKSEILFEFEYDIPRTTYDQ